MSIKTIVLKQYHPDSIASDITAHQAKGWVLMGPAMPVLAEYRLAFFATMTRTKTIEEKEDDQ
jgi:hypothetical protein